MSDTGDLVCAQCKVLESECNLCTRCYDGLEQKVIQYFWQTLVSRVLRLQVDALMM